MPKPARPSDIGRAQAAERCGEGRFCLVREVNTAKSDQPFVQFSDMMTQNFEQTRKAMEKYADLFEKGMKSSPWLDADLKQENKGLHRDKYCCCKRVYAEAIRSQGCPVFLAGSDQFHLQTQWKMLSELMKDLSEKCDRCIRAHFYCWSSAP